MPKIDFSALKTADLRSVAPINEGMRPSVSVPEAPLSVQGAVLNDAVSAQAVPAPAVPSVPVREAEPVPAIPASKPIGHVQKKISLMNLKTTGNSSVPKSERPTETAAATIDEWTRPSVSVPEAPAMKIAPRTAISLGGKPKVSEPEETAETIENPPVSMGVSEWESAETPETQSPRLVEGVDIIAPAKVVGTEWETLANEILAKSLEDPEEAKKRALEEAAEAIVIPESKKEFFPNLEMEDDFFKDPMFEGIVPQKEEAPAEVAVVVEAAVPDAAEASSETVRAESVDAVADSTGKDETETEASIVEDAAAESEVLREAVMENASEEPSATGKDESPDGLLILPESAAVPELVEPTIPETPAEPADSTYVETVAKELSETRKGGLSKLFGERKVLVRSIGGLAAVAALSIGTFAFVSPSVKTSVPEALPTDAWILVPEIPPADPMGTAAPESSEASAVLSSQDAPFTRVHSIRRPNRKTQPLPQQAVAEDASAWSGEEIPSATGSQAPAP